MTEENYIKRPRTHVLEEESKNALRLFLPKEWIVRFQQPDYGIDAEIEVVECGKVTGKRFLVQLKAKNYAKCGKEITYQIKTRYLKYYENNDFPVVILCWIKPKNIFYYSFAQKCIWEKLDVEKIDWRRQKTIAIKLDSAIDIEYLKSLATDGVFYIVKRRKPELWLDGIPESENKELKERTAKALSYIAERNVFDAIKELEKILKTFNFIEKSQRVAILTILGAAYNATGQHGKALDNYNTVLEITDNTHEREILEGRVQALGGIGLVFRAKGEPSEAVKYFLEELKIAKDIKYKFGEVDVLSNLALICKDANEMDLSLTLYKKALKIVRKIGFKWAEASILLFISEIYRAKGRNWGWEDRYLRKAMELVEKKDILS